MFDKSKLKTYTSQQLADFRQLFFDSSRGEELSLVECEIERRKEAEILENYKLMFDE